MALVLKRRPPPRLSLIDVMDDPHLFATHFQPAESWQRWQVVLRAAFGLPLSRQQLTFFQKYTGRTRPPPKAVREAWIIAGRRGGKSRIAALIAVFLACFRDYRPHLAPGERAVVMLLAADKRQARVCMRYVRGLLDVPMLRALITSSNAEEIHLTNRASIEVHAASFRSTRGYTLGGVICDEIAFWRSDESANPDSEILAALRPGMTTIPGAMLIGISSPYAQRGVLFEAHRRHYGNDDSKDALVWQSPTHVLNPSVDRRVIDRAYEEDPSSASAEFGGEFRRDIEMFLSREIIASVTVPGREFLLANPNHRYVAFCDPSGGSGDSMTLAVAHDEGTGDRRIAVLDLIRDVRPPFSPDDVVRDFTHAIGKYGLDEITGDRYGAEWVRERFAARGVWYRASELTKSEIYLELSAAVYSRRVELLDSKRLTAQLASLERRAGRSGKDSVDHPPRAHDDLANAAAGALWLALRPSRVIEGLRF